MNSFTVQYGGSTMPSADDLESIKWITNGVRRRSLSLLFFLQNQIFLFRALTGSNPDVGSSRKNIFG